MNMNKLFVGVGYIVQTTLRVDCSSNLGMEMQLK